MTSTRVVSFRDVLYGVAKRDGQIPEHSDLDAGIAIQMTEGINTAVKFAWEYYKRGWADIVEVLEFPLAPHPHLQTPWIPRDQPTFYIAHVFGAYRNNPLLHKSPCHAPFRLHGDGLYFDAGEAGTGNASIFVRVREEAPVFSAIPHDASRGYAKGEAVYWPTDGHGYTATADVPAGTTPAASSTLWQRRPIPKVLADAVKAGAYAIYLGGDGQGSAGAAMEAAMMSFLDEEILIQEDQQQSLHVTRR